VSNKPMILVTAPVATRSGYGNHSRDICRALIELDKYDVKINSVRWGTTPMNALEKGNPIHQEIHNRIITNPNLDRQPELHMHIVVPNEFQPLGKKNIGVTAGIEHTVPPYEWINGVNRMDMVICTSEFTKETFEKASYTGKDKNTGKETTLKAIKPLEVLFEGADVDTYKQSNEFSLDFVDTMKKVDEDFCFLYVGHWLQGNLGEDRKDTGMMVKVFLETFKNQKNPPALIMKTSGATFSIIDREEILDKIKTIKDSISAKSLPNVYVLHGDFKDEEMNQMYNHPKVKAHLSFTHGEGFGRPLLEASFSGKPILAPLWSGQKDFLNKDYVVELQHTLTKVPKSAFPKEFSNNEALWATVNYSMASQAMRNIVKDYKRYELKGKKLMIVNRQLFSHEAMKEKLEGIVDKTLDGVPMQVGLTLPKLKKKGSPSSKIKLPKLKRG